MPIGIKIEKESWQCHECLKVHKMRHQAEACENTHKQETCKHKWFFYTHNFDNDTKLIRSCEMCGKVEGKSLLFSTDFECQEKFKELFELLTHLKSFLNY